MRKIFFLLLFISSIAKAQSVYNAPTDTSTGANQATRFLGMTWKDGSNYYHVTKLPLSVFSKTTDTFNFYKNAPLTGLGTIASPLALDSNVWRVDYSGHQNSAIGYQALKANTTGIYNSAFGYQSLTANTTGSRNTAVGIFSMFYGTAGTDNTAIGAVALQNTTGNNNTGVGSYSLNGNAGGHDNTAFGYYSGFTNSSGNYNTSVGSSALSNGASGSGNTAIGVSGLVNNTADYNTAIGFQAMLSNTSGTQNTAYGVQALANSITGSYNVGIGFQSQLPVSYTHSGNIGHTIFWTGDNGHDTVSSTASLLGINKINPAYTLDVNGTANVSGILTVLTASAGTNTTQAASTAFVSTAVNNAISGANPAVAVQAATTANVSGYTYNNGASGIGATLTQNSAAVVVIDGYTLLLNDRILFKNQTTAANNGVYVVATLGTGLVSAIFTRATDYNQPSDINNTGAIPVVNGTANTTTSWLLTSAVTTVGTDPLTFTQFSYNPSTIVTLTGAQTLSNKRWTARVGSTTSSATPTINTDNVDIYKLTALSTAITSMTSSLSGTPVDGDILEIQFTDNGTARAITWGASFGSSSVALPTTTVISTTLTVVLQYFSNSSYGNTKWICVNSF